MTLKKMTAIVLPLFLFIVFPLTASAEFSSELYLGGTVTEDDEYEFKVSGNKADEDVDFDSSFTIGYRLGYWLDQLPWLGIAIDGSYFSADDGDADLDIIPVSALVMFQIPLLKSTNFPRGEYIPYAGIGPAVFFSDFDLDVEGTVIPDLVNTPALSGDFSDQSEDVGLDVRLGIKKMFSTGYGLLFEYRFTSFSPDFDDTIFGEKIKSEIDVNTHHFLLGISYYF